MRGVLRYKMALLERLKLKNRNLNIEIADNLPTLQFESALSEEEKSLLHLRTRSHATLVSICAQATYFVDVINEGRQIKNQLKSPHSRASRILQDLNAKDLLQIGIAGCGHLGSQLANCLLTFGKINPTNLKISTRRPETLEHLMNLGVECYNNNIKLASSVNLVFVCVLPSQFAFVAEEIRDHLDPSTIIYAMASSISARKVKRMFCSENVLKPECLVNMKNFTKPWEYISISSALEIKENVDRTNPFYPKKSECIVSSPAYFGAVIMYAFLNMCTSFNLCRGEALQALHLAVFGETDKEPLKDRVRQVHVAKIADDEEKLFPIFDLVDVAETKGFLLKKIVESDVLKKAFANRYWEIYEQYVHHKAYGQV